MALFSFTDQEHADKAIEASRAAWDEGRRHFVHELRAASSTKNDFGNTVGLAIDGIVDVGWRLHSVTPFVNTLGPNNKEVLLTFERPASA